MTALPPDVLPRFVEKARELYPQHYALILLGFATGSWHDGAVQRTLLEGCATVWSSLSEAVAAVVLAA